MYLNKTWRASISNIFYIDTVIFITNVCIVGFRKSPFICEQKEKNDCNSKNALFVLGCLEIRLFSITFYFPL